MSEAVIVHQATKTFTGSNLVQRKRAAGHGSGTLTGQLHAVVAVDSVSFTVQNSEIFGLAGPSGSGKSTLIRLLAALLLPDSGEMSIFGYNVKRYPAQVQRLTNRVSVEASFFKRLSALDNLLYGAHLYGSAGLEMRRRVIELLLRLGLAEDEIYQPMEMLRREAQHLVFLARALLRQPRLMLLDEPTASLGHEARKVVYEILLELRDQFGTTILIAMRDVSQASMFCDRVGLLESGRIIAVENSANLRINYQILSGQPQN